MSTWKGAMEFFGQDGKKLDSLTLKRTTNGEWRMKNLIKRETTQIQVKVQKLDCINRSNIPNSMLVQKIAIGND